MVVVVFCSFVCLFVCCLFLVICLIIVLLGGAVVRRPPAPLHEGQWPKRISENQRGRETDRQTRRQLSGFDACLTITLMAGRDRQRQTRQTDRQTDRQTEGTQGLYKINVT